MKLNNIMSNALPDIDEAIKECVNLGQWLLFKSAQRAGGNNKVAFYLKIGSEVFELDDKGRVVRELRAQQSDISIDELFYFSDLPRPSSLSNMSFVMQ